MTAEARREVARQEFEVFFDECPSRLVLTRLAEKWVAYTIHLLGAGPLRHSELRRGMPGITQKMLTQTLRNLEQDGIVSRAVEPTVPVTVSYSLTPLGHSLGGLLSEVIEWSEGHAERIVEARARHD